jgi:hypothetical protein
LPTSQYGSARIAAIFLYDCGLNFMPLMVPVENAMRYTIFGQDQNVFICRLFRLCLYILAVLVSDWVKMPSDTWAIS